MSASSWPARTTRQMTTLRARYATLVHEPNQACQHVSHLHPWHMPTPPIALLGLHYDCTLTKYALGSDTFGFEQHCSCMHRCKEMRQPCSLHSHEALILVCQVAEGSSRRAQGWGALSKAGAAVHSSSASVSNLTELMHKGRNMVKVSNPHPTCAPALYVTTHSCSIKVPLGRDAFALLMYAYCLYTANYPWACQHCEKTVVDSEVYNGIIIQAASNRSMVCALIRFMSVLCADLCG